MINLFSKQSELTAVASLDVQPERIIFANPVKTKTMLRHAAQLQVRMMTFDSLSELVKIQREYPQAQLVIRLKVDDSSSHFQLGKKFGVELDEAIRLLTVAASMRANVIGIAFHVGSDCHKADSYESAIQYARIAFDIARSMNFNMKLLDIGGGFPGVVDFNDPTHCFYRMVKNINAALDHYFPISEFPDLKIISEPGRYFAATSATLVTKIIGKRPYKLDSTSSDEDDEEDEDHVLHIHRNKGIMYFLNDGLFGDLLGKVWEPHYFKLVPGISKDEMIKRNCYQSIVWGPTCDSTDVVADGVNLPEMQVGEYFLSPDYGAYTSCLKTSFNGMEGAIFKYFLSDKYKSVLKSTE